MGARQSSLSNVQSSAFSRRQLRAHRINRTGMDHSQTSNAPEYVRKATASPNSTDLELIELEAPESSAGRNSNQR